MRHERHRRAELLLDLGGVPVREHAVRGDAAMVLAEMRPIAGRLAGAGNAGLGIDDDAAFEQAGCGQRLEREQRGRRIAAGARDQLRPANGVGMPLRQPVDHSGRQRGRRRIPALPIGVAADAEGAREVDDATVALQQRRADVRGRGFGQRQKHDVGVGGEAIDVERRDRAVPDALERRQRPGRARRARRHRLGQRDRRMPRQQADELLPGVAGGARDRDAGAGAAAPVADWVAA